jgi:3'-phosphoadenosine 5'-phosphosulfate sulfotransferase
MEFPPYKKKEGVDLIQEDVEGKKDLIQEDVEGKKDLIQSIKEGGVEDFSFNPLTTDFVITGNIKKIVKDLMDSNIADYVFIFGLSMTVKPVIIQLDKS